MVHCATQACTTPATPKKSSQACRFMMTKILGLFGEVHGLIFIVRSVDRYSNGEGPLNWWWIRWVLFDRRPFYYSCNFSHRLQVTKVTQSSQPQFDAEPQSAAWEAAMVTPYIMVYWTTPSLIVVSWTKTKRLIIQRYFNSKLLWKGHMCFLVFWPKKRR